jgi:hypothetical protein
VSAPRTPSTLKVAPPSSSASMTRFRSCALSMGPLAQRRQCTPNPRDRRTAAAHRKLAMPTSGDQPGGNSSGAHTSRKPADRAAWSTCSACRSHCAA